ncbi:Small subunit (SSU) processome component [Pseudocyphellaria aurata]|nr:Small subunit (SSU) processome component [Pseudocyphellaria aurata]
MVSKKSSRGTASKVSSSAAPASSSATQTASKSSIIKSLFLPSRYQLALFASVIQGLDSQHIRIHDTNTGKLQCEHAIGSKASINCLDWGYYGKIHRDQYFQQPNKKRKRRTETNDHDSEPNAGDVVLAVGTSDSEIEIYSVTRAKIVKVLKGAHSQGVKDFKFADDGRTQEAWSVGGDGKLIQWDVLKGTTLRSLQVPTTNATILHPLASAMLFASQHTAYLLDFEFDKPTPFTASIHPVHTIISSSSDSKRPFSFLTAAESDRFMTVFDNVSDQSNGMLCTENEIISADLYSRNRDIGKSDEKDSGIKLQPEQVLLAVNKDGVLEIFSSPFTFSSPATPQKSEDRKARIKQRIRKADALVKIVRPDKSNTTVPVSDASFQGNDVVMAWTEGGINLIFHRIPFRAEETGKILLTGTCEITKWKGGPSIGAAVMNGVKDMGRNHVDESHTVVVNGEVLKDEAMVLDQPEILDVSSGEDDSEYEEESVPEQIEDGSNSGEEDIEMQDVGNDNGGEIEKLETPLPAQAKGDAPGKEQSEVAEEPQSAKDPSFGELLRANAPEPVDVQAALAIPEEHVVAPTGEKELALPSGMSLATVLTQSLRTNDVNLLETCFHVKDLSTVRATIERLDSSLATVLLQRLAERLHSRPGRAGSLMVWIQWTLVAHGGYLANQPDVMKKLRSLYQVVKDRANSLQPLLSLKGKLDMLEAQMNLRKNMQARSRVLNAMIEDEEEGVIYVEGQEESDSEIDVADRLDSGHVHPVKDMEHDDSSHPGSDIGSDEEEDKENGEEDDDEEEDDEEDDMPTTINGIGHDASSEATESEDDKLIDDEASSTDHDSDDDASSDVVDHESVDSLDSAAMSEPEAPPAKRHSKAKLSNGIGGSKG